MRVIRYRTAPPGDQSGGVPWTYPCRSALLGDPWGIAYYRAVHGADLSEHSFALEHEATIVAIVACDSAGPFVGRFGLPLEPWFKPGLAYPNIRQAVTDTAAELRRLAKALDRPAVQVRVLPEDDAGGMLLGHLVQNGGTVHLELRAEADLTLPASVLFDDLRTAHRQNVRWGDKNLTLSFVDATEPDHGRFEAYRLFHADVAGRVTRGPESWQAMYDMIARGRGDLVLGHLDGELVSGTLVLDGLDTAVYASGVYRRERFDKSLGHAPMFSAMTRAKERGRQYFDVGAVALASHASAKEQAIGHFKRGFTSRTRTSVLVDWPVDPATSATPRPSS